MKKNILKSILVLGLTFLALPTFAKQIENLQIATDGKFVTFSWEKLSKNDIDEETKYALQWNESSGNVRLDKPVSAFASLSDNEFRMQGNLVFEKNKTYYARVYSYYRKDRETYLTNGSKILKFKWLYNGNVETSYINANDPNVVNNSNNSSVVSENFGKIRTIEYDTATQIFWSDVNEIFDEFYFVLADNYELKDPIAEFSVHKDHNKALITGLKPAKKYYIAGYLKRNDRKFGKSKIYNFSTLKEFSHYKKERFEKYVLNKNNYGAKLSVKNGGTTEETSSTTESTKKKPTSKSEIKSRISELKKLIAKYEAEIRSLEKKLPASERSTISSRKNTSRSLTRPRRSRLRSLLRGWRR